ncbi:hypothetical protein FQZ97_904740 [compost metagenome]
MPKILGQRRQPYERMRDEQPADHEENGNTRKPVQYLGSDRRNRQVQRRDRMHEKNLDRGHQSDEVEVVVALSLHAHTRKRSTSKEIRVACSCCHSGMDQSACPRIAAANACNSSFCPLFGARVSKGFWRLPATVSER